MVRTPLRERSCNHQTLDLNQLAAGAILKLQPAKPLVLPKEQLAKDPAAVAHGRKGSGSTDKLRNWTLSVP